jgi:hypothetical protein
MLAPGKTPLASSGTWAPKRASASSAESRSGCLPAYAASGTQQWKYVLIMKFTNVCMLVFFNVSG